jgi:hypothetical protein
MNVIDLRKRLQVVRGGKSEVKGASAGAKGNMSREEVLLLRLADKIDTMILDNILEHNLTAPEIAALMAHRLGRLVMAMPSLPGCANLDIEKLKSYLHEVIERESGDPEASLKKSS